MNISLYFRTLRHLRPVQFWGRARLYCRNSFGRRRIDWKELAPIPAVNRNLTHFPWLENAPCYNHQNNTFSFLNLAYHFSGEIDWEFAGLGRLWLYNLNYHEFLLQSNLDSTEKHQLIEHFIHHLDNSRTALEPYPISLRTIHWVKLFSEPSWTHNFYWDAVLYRQVRELLRQLEFHLLGNHLLENGFSLLFAAYYFRDAKLLVRAERILRPELDEQILPDGAHFELSPMYHCIMLHRMLDCYNLQISNPDIFGECMVELFRKKCQMMISWLQAIKFSSGSIPLLNDSALGVTASPEKLIQYGRKLGITPCDNWRLKESGLRKFCCGTDELIFDAGAIGPDYLCGHAHADTFHFELHRNGQLFLCDTGCSSYEPGVRRLYERGTPAHNTVVIAGRNSSEVWGSHRVGSRARVTIEQELPGQITASHNGYQRWGEIHRRTVRKETVTGTFRIIDEIKGQGMAYFHFAPGLEPSVSGNKVQTASGELCFDGAEELTVEDGLYAQEYNKLIPCKILAVSFSQHLTTLIS